MRSKLDLRGIYHRDCLDLGRGAIRPVTLFTINPGFRLSLLLAARRRSSRHYWWVRWGRRVFPCYTRGP